MGGETARTTAGATVGVWAGIAAALLAVMPGGPVRAQQAVPVTPLLTDHAAGRGRGYGDLLSAPVN